MGTSLVVTLVFRSVVKCVRVWSSVCLPQPLVASSFTDMGGEGRRNLPLRHKGRGDAIFKAGNDYTSGLRPFPVCEGLPVGQFLVNACLVVPLEVGSLQLPVNKRGGRSLPRRTPGNRAALRGRRPAQLHGLVPPARRGPCRPPSSSAAPGAARIHPPRRALLG